MAKAKSPEKMRQRLDYLEGRQIVLQAKSDSLLEIIRKSEEEINTLRESLKTP